MIATINGFMDTGSGLGRWLALDTLTTFYTSLSSNNIKVYSTLIVSVIRMCTRSKTNKSRRVCLFRKSLKLQVSSLVDGTWFGWHHCALGRSVLCLEGITDIFHLDPLNTLLCVDIFDYPV